MSATLQNRTFILGAGFSAAAGLPLTGHLFGSLLRSLEDCCGGVGTRLRHLMDASGIPQDPEPPLAAKAFADFCTLLEYHELRESAGGECWSDNGSREKLSLKFALARHLMDNTPTSAEIGTLYRSFAEELHSGDIVLSFNWDVLLETALQAVGTPYSCKFAEDAVWLAKMHGSVDWRRGLPVVSPRHEWDPLGYASGQVEQDLYSCSGLLKRHAWRDLRPLGEVEPFLVLPGYGKAHDVRAISALWYKPEFAFASTHDVVIIGLSLSPDDFFIRAFLMNALRPHTASTSLPPKRITVIDPGENARINYGFLEKDKGLHFLAEEFAMKHIRQFAERRSSM